MESNTNNCNQHHQAKPPTNKLLERLMSAGGQWYFMRMAYCYQDSLDCALGLIYSRFMLMIDHCANGIKIQGVRKVWITE